MIKKLSYQCQKEKGMQIQVIRYLVCLITRIDWPNLAA